MLTGHDKRGVLNHGRLILLTSHDTSTALSHGHLLILKGHDEGSVLNYGRLIFLTGSWYKYCIRELRTPAVFERSWRQQCIEAWTLDFVEGHETSTALSHGHLLMLTGHDEGSVLNHGHLILLTGHDTSTAVGVADTCWFWKAMMPIVYWSMDAWFCWRVVTQALHWTMDTCCLWNETVLFLWSCPPPPANKMYHFYMRNRW